MLIGSVCKHRCTCVMPLLTTCCLCGNVCSEEPRGAQGKQPRVSTGLKSRFTMTSSRVRVHRDRMLRTLETRIQGVKLKTRRARGLIRRASAVRFVLFVLGILCAASNRSLVAGIYSRTGAMTKCNKHRF